MFSAFFCMNALQFFFLGFIVCKAFLLWLRCLLCPSGRLVSSLLSGFPLHSYIHLFVGNPTVRLFLILFVSNKHQPCHFKWQHASPPLPPSPPFLFLSSSEDICTTWWSFLSEYRSCNWAPAEQTWRAHRGREKASLVPPSIPVSPLLSSLPPKHRQTHTPPRLENRMLIFIPDTSATLHLCLCLREHQLR